LTDVVFTNLTVINTCIPNESFLMCVWYACSDPISNELGLS